MTKQESIKVAAAIFEKTITLGYTTDETFCYLNVEEDRITITPDDATAFFHLEQVVKVCSALELGCYVRFNDGKIHVRIY